MKAPRLSEVLLPLLAARGWAPWQVEPGDWLRQRLVEAPRNAAVNTPSWRDRQNRLRLYDDVQ